MVELAQTSGNMLTQQLEAVAQTSGNMTTWQLAAMAPLPTWAHGSWQRWHLCQHGHMEVCSDGTSANLGHMAVDSDGTSANMGTRLVMSTISKRSEAKLR
jgi:hypothetical protein